MIERYETEKDGSKRYERSTFLRPLSITFSLLASFIPLFRKLIVVLGSLWQGVVIEGGFMRRGNDMGGRIAEGGGSIEWRRVTTPKAIKQGVMKEPKLRNT